MVLEVPEANERQKTRISTVMVDLSLSEAHGQTRT